MKNIDEILQNASNLKLDKELLSEEEIRRIVDNLPEKSSNFVKLIKRIIIMTVPVLIVFISLYFAVLNEPASEQEKVSPKKLNNSAIINNLEGDEKKSESIDVIFEDMNQKLDSSDQNSKIFIKPPIEINNVGFSAVPATAKRDPNPLETLPWKIKGMTILKLNDEEFAKLVPDSRINDKTYYIYKESLIDEEIFKENELDERGYKIEDLPLINLTYGTFSQDHWCFTVGTKEFYKYNKYKKTLYIAFSTTDHIMGEGRGMYNTYTPILLDNCQDSMMRYYSEFQRNYSMMLYNTRYRDKDSVAYTKLHEEKMRLDNILFANLVPVAIEVYEATVFIFWFYPNEEFLSALPERYSVNLRKELEVKELLESGTLDIADACKGLDTDNSVFGLCRYSEGAIKFDNLYPNPESIQSKLSFTLMQNRKLNIIIHDVSGRIVKELVNDVQYNAGSYDIDIPLDDLPQGINYIIIKTNENETIVKRIIKM